jgi:hypothetical protein
MMCRRLFANIGKLNLVSLNLVACPAKTIQQIGFDEGIMVV